MKKFKQFWKAFVNPPRMVEIRDAEDRFIVSWREGNVNYEESFDSRMAAEEKATELYGGDITFMNDVPTEKMQRFFKSSDALTKEEIREVQKYIEGLQAKGKNASQIIKALQSYNNKLSEYYKAKRAFETENKNMQSEAILDSADQLDIHKFKVIINPNACKLCREKTNNGEKIFKASELNKSGYGHRPPFHPGCYCSIIPY